MRQLLFAVMVTVFIVMTGCSSDKGEDGGVMEIINMQGTCDVDGGENWTSCCDVECKEYCAIKEYPYANHHANLHHCACWCG